VGIHLMPPLFQMVIGGKPKSATGLADSKEMYAWCNLQATFLDAYNANGVSYSNGAPLVLGRVNRPFANSWQIDRGIFVFDTTGVKITENVVRAYLHYQFADCSTTYPSTAAFVNANGISLPSDETLFQQLRSKNTILAQRDMIYAQRDTWLTDQISPGQLDVINREGLTIIGVRTLSDVTQDGSIPAAPFFTGFNLYGVRSPGKEPYLEIHTEGF
jgi:hypothetical protein